MEITIIAVLVISHFIFDFFLQSREMAEKKSSELKWLLYHMALIFNGTIWPLLFLQMFTDIFTLYSLVGIPVVVTLVHGIIDWNLWRGYKYFRRYEDIKTFQYWKDSLFYDTIGLDQMLHMLTLIVAVAILI